MKTVQYAVVFISLILSSCSLNDTNYDVIETHSNHITIEEAKELYDTYCEAQTSRSIIGSRIPFLIGDALLHWNEAGISFIGYLSAVDIPISNNYTYNVSRIDTDNKLYTVPTTSHIVIVKDYRTCRRAIYVRVRIPNKDYDYSNMENLGLNFNSRSNFCGLEYYTTLEGSPVGIAKFSEGKIVEGIFLGDTKYSAIERTARFKSLFSGIYISQNSGDTRNEGDMIYGAPGEIFQDQNGSIYVYVDLDGDGISDAVTMYWSALEGNNSNGGNSSAGSGGSAPTVPSWGDNSGNSSGIPVGGGDSGSSSEEGDGDNGNGNSNRNEGGGTEMPTVPEYNVKSDSLNSNWIYVEGNPVPFVSPETQVGGDSEPKPEVRTQPYADFANWKADPLIEMEICPTPGQGRKGGLYLSNRNNYRKHQGIDLIANIGDAVFSMFDGEVINIVNHYDPEVEWKDYEDLYIDYDKGCQAAGNRISIRSTTPNGVIVIKYFHLESVVRGIGELINAGEIIGFAGATGAAGSTKSSGGPHLHIEVRLPNGRSTSPNEYLYTSFDEDGNKIND